MASEQAAAVCAALHDFALKAGLLDDALDVQKTRAAMETLGALPIDDSITVKELTVAGRPALWLLPEGGDMARRLLHLHGGAYTSGGLASHKPLAATLALRFAMPVLLLDYRLAPEHPFPAALEDAVAAFEWLTAHEPEGAAKARGTYLTGDSAGGGLAIAATLALRDRDRTMPEAVAAMSGWLDLSEDVGRSLRVPSEEDGCDPIIGAGWAADSARAYVGSEEARDPLISPIFGRYDHDFPPLLLQVGTREYLLSQNEAFATQAVASGAPVELEVWPEMFHSWHTCGPALPEADEALARIHDFFRATPGWSAGTGAGR